MSTIIRGDIEWCSGERGDLGTFFVDDDGKYLLVEIKEKDIESIKNIIDELEDMRIFIRDNSYKSRVTCRRVAEVFSTEAIILCSEAANALSRFCPTIEVQEEE